MKLTATFTLKLSQPFFVFGPVEKISFKTHLDDFEDKITLIPMGKGHEVKSIGDQWPTYCITTLILSVSSKDNPTPPTEFNEDGTPNKESIQYYNQRTDKYVNHAKLIITRLILFFKYELHNPLLNSDELDYLGLYNPVWTNESGQKMPTIGCGLMEQIKGFAPDSRFGSRALNYTDAGVLKECIEHQRRAELFEELLSDAQTALFQNNHRRALLELAITCEVAIKQKFFMKKTPAGDVFEYLEDSRRLNVSVLELIHGVAKQAFSSSFKEVSLLDYKNIDHLFRCRNKIAHRGEIKYKDDTGNIQKVDDVKIKQWWESAEILLNWLEKI